ncbi:MAG: hypothetical protein IT165_08185 [Bryobacterales bacterium]|nr:hypothetical protein [Bryobacterales bacterium]
MTEAMRPYLDRLQSRALMVGVAGLLATGAGFAMNSEQFYRSYLLAFMLWAGVALGSLSLLMLHHMVGGGWGVAIRRGLEAGTRTLPLVVLLFLPLAFGVHSLYEWSHPDVVAKDPVLQSKQMYLNQTGFYIRAVIYFVIWFFLTARLNKMTEEQERVGYWAIRPRLQRLSAPGIIVHSLCITFASVDWVMSIEPHYFSTIYGAIFMVNQALSTFAVMIFVLCLLATKEPMQGVVKTQTYHDLGSLMFAFNMLWAYVSFSQLLIVWSANLPEEIAYYVKRMRGGWEYVGLAVFLFHFCVIFVLLLMRKVKRNPHLLRKVAAYVLAMRVLDLFWVIRPAFSHGMENGTPVSHFSIHWLDIAAPVALGGIWMAFFAFQLKKRSLEPLALE